MTREYLALRELRDALATHDEETGIVVMEWRQGMAPLVLGDPARRLHRALVQADLVLAEQLSFDERPITVEDVERAGVEAAVTVERLGWEPEP